MKRTTVLFLLFTLVFAVAEASQIESNHSYFRNSNFLSDYDVTIKGYGDTKLNYFESEEGVANSLNTDLAVHLDIQGKVEENYKYGIQVIGRFNSEFKKNESYFIYIDNYYGRFELGNTLAATEVTRVGGDSIARGNGGIFGEFSRYIVLSLPTGYYFPLREGTLSNQFFGHYNGDMNIDYYDHFSYTGKINYYSPEFLGFQASLSFTPKNEIRMNQIDESYTGSEVLNIGNVVSYGVNYVNTFGNLGVAFSLAAENGVGLLADEYVDGDETKKIENEVKMHSEIAGINISYFGFTLGASAGLLNKNDLTDTQFTSVTKEKARYMSYAAGYEIGNVFVGYSFFEGEVVETNIFSADSFSLEIKSNKNVSLYAEYTNFSVEGTKGTTYTKNRGKMIALGVLINFY